MRKGNLITMLWAIAALIACLMIVSPASAEVVLRVGIGMADAGQLDPHISAKTQDKCVFGWMFNGLARLKPGSMDLASLEPDLAERWESSADGLTWTFYLRKGVKFHGDYGEFTAEDVVYSLNRAKNPKISGFSSDYADFESVEALEKYAVRIKLAKPVPSLLALVSNYHGGNIVSKKAAEEMGENFKTHPIGTGPFAFVDYKPKQSVTLVAHKDYFRGKPKIDKIIYRYIPSAASRELAFTKGELDLTYGVRQKQWVERMRKKQGIIVDVFQPGELRTLHMNMSKKPLGHIRVRKAIAHALDRNEVVSFLGEEVTQINYTVVPNGYLGHTSDVPRYEHNPEKAKALLKESGYPNGFTITSIVSKRPPLLAPMQIVQEQLRKVGIKVELEVVEHATYHSQIRDDLSPLVIYGAARFPIADTYLTQFYHSRSIVGTPTAVTNFSHNNVADAEIDAARSEADPKKQLEYWKKAQQKIMAESVAYPFCELLQVWVRGDNLDYGYDLKAALSLGPIINEKTHFK
jgi:peptide/nickel transport system substrate-binding protein